MRRHDSTPRRGNPAAGRLPPVAADKDNRASALLARALLIENGEPVAKAVPAPSRAATGEVAP